MRSKAKQDKLLALTKGMLAAAQAKDWAMVSELELQRNHAFDALFSDPDNADDKSAIIDLITTILAMDQELIATVENSMQSIAKELSAITICKKSASAYATISATVDPYHK